jgi:predicted acyltransferase
VFRWQEGEKTVNLQGWLYQNIHAVALPPYLASLAWALSTVLFWLALLAVLDRKGIYLKV